MVFEQERQRIGKVYKYCTRFKDVSLFLVILKERFSLYLQIEIMLNIHYIHVTFPQYPNTSTYVDTWLFMGDALF